MAQANKVRAYFLNQTFSYLNPNYYLFSLMLVEQLVVAELPMTNIKLTIKVLPNR